MWILLASCATAPGPQGPAPIASSVVTAEKPDCAAPAPCEQACSSGDALACNQVGLFVHDGRAGAKRSPMRAAANYRKACDLGAGIGCYNLSQMARSGDGVPQDEAEADVLLAKTHRLYEKSCAGGGLTWCTNLAGLVQRGEGREPDQDQARNLYSDTCDRGDPIACLELAYMVREGHGGAADPAAAQAILEATCDKGSGPACNNLGLMVETGGGDPMPLFSKACELDVAMACRNVGLRLSEDIRLPYLEKACDASEQPDAMACAIAGQMLGVAQPPNLSKAGTYLVRACSLGLRDACVPAVQLAASGDFLLSPGEANALIERGCRLGDAVACEILAGAPE